MEINDAVEDFVKEFVSLMVEADSEAEQMIFINAALNLTTNALAAFVAERIVECECSNCRKGAHKFLETIKVRMENVINLTINANLKASDVGPLYEVDPAFDLDTNRATYEEIMKEIGDVDKNG